MAEREREMADALDHDAALAEDKVMKPSMLPRREIPVRKTETDVAMRKLLDTLDSVSEGRFQDKTYDGLDPEAKYIMAGYPSAGDVGRKGMNAYVYVDHAGRLCIHGGMVGGCLFIDALDLHVITGDVAPGH